MAFGVVLFTLLVQGLTMKPFIARMGLIEKDPAQEEYEGINARLVMARTAYKQLETMYKDGLLSKHVWNVLSKPITARADTLADTAAKTMRAHPDVETKEMESAIKAVLTSEKTTLRSLLRDGRISEDTFSSLVHEVDSALTENQSELVQILRMRTIKNIEVLMTIVIQEKDFQKISTLLEPYGYPMTHIASTGGFLGRRNATVLIGLPRGKRLEIRKLLESANVSKLKIDSENPKPTPGITHEGATIFSLDIERYEEL